MKQEDVNGHRVAVYQDPREAVRHSVQHGPKSWFNRHDEYWIGRRFSSAADLENRWGHPWPEGLRLVDRMRKELNPMVGTPPSTRKRVRCLSDHDGDFDFDRYQSGEPDFFHGHRRAVSRGPATVTLLCPIGGRFKDRAESLMWRGAAVTVVVDALEDAGYGVEVWWWNRSEESFTGGACRHYFTGSKIKSAGDPLDTDLLIRVMSTWFYRGVVLPGMSVRGRDVDKGLGFNRPNDLGFCRRYFDLDQGTTVLEMPSAVDLNEAVRGAKDLLARFGGGG